MNFGTALSMMAMKRSDIMKTKVSLVEQKQIREINRACRYCGIPRETGSQIWYECPKTGKWKSVSDYCDLEENESV